MREAIWIGIDPGTNTGIGVWDRKAKAYLKVLSGSFWEAIREVDDSLDKAEKAGLAVRARIEDSRKDNLVYNAQKYFKTVRASSNEYSAIAAVTKMGRGVGIVDRDSGLWEEYFKARGIPVDLVAPSSRRTNLDLKIKAGRFKILSKWQGRTNEHARDAAMLVFNK